MPGSFPGVRGQHSGIDVVPEAVARARVEAGLTQAQVAEPGFTRAAVSMVERGKMKPSKHLLRQIAARTARPLSYFLADSTMTEEHRQVTDRLHHLVAKEDFASAIREGERMLKQELPRLVEAETRFLVGRAYVRSLDGSHAYAHLVKARELYELTGEQAQFADVLNQMACALFLLDDPRSLTVAYQALDACERLRPPQTELMVRTLMVLGMMFHRLQDWERAIIVYERARHQIGAAMGIRNLAMIHDVLSMSYQRIGSFAQALRHARKARRFYRGSVDPTDLFKAEHNLGETLLKQGELRAARPYLERALAICDAAGLQRQARGFALISLAELHIGSGELELAEARLTEALALVQQLGERVHEAGARRLWGRLHLQRGEYERADQAYAASTQLYKDLELPADILDVQAEHADCLERQGRTQEALALSRQAIASGRLAARLIKGGWADIVAGHKRR